MPSFLHFNIFTQRIPNDHQRDKEICTVLRCESNIENKHDQIEAKYVECKSEKQNGMKRDENSRVKMPTPKKMAVMA